MKLQSKFTFHIYIFAVVLLCGGAFPDVDAQDAKADDAKADRALDEKAVAALTRRLNEIIIPRLEFEEATIQDAAAYLHDKSLAGEQPLAPVNIVLRNLKNPGLITLRLEKVPMMTALKYCAEAAGLEMRVEPHAVVFASKFDDPGAIFKQRFAVPIEFLSHPDFSGEEEQDPFLEEDGVDIVPLSQGGAGIIRALKARGIDFPEASSAEWDGFDLTIQNTKANLEKIEDLIWDWYGYLPTLVHTRVELYAMANLRALQLVEQYDTTPDWTPAVRELRRMVETGEASLLAAPSLVTKNATRALSSLGHEQRFIDSFAEKEGRDVPVEKSIFLGTKLEIDPLIGADNHTVDMVISLHHSFGGPKTVRRKVIAPVSGEERMVEALEVRQGRVATALTFQDGQARLLGLLSLPAEAGPGGEARTVIVVGKVWLVPLFDRERGREKK